MHNTLERTYLEIECLQNILNALGTQKQLVNKRNKRQRKQDKRLQKNILCFLLFTFKFLGTLQNHLSLIRFLEKEQIFHVI